MVSWCSRKQTSVALSTAEVKYIGASMAAREAVWLRSSLQDCLDEMMDPTVIHCDNQSCVKLSENPIAHDRSKIVEIKFHYIRDMVLRKAVLMQYLPPDEQIADVLTQPLAKLRFEYFRDKLGVVENAPLVKRAC
jgi:hypothetical protein